MGLFHKTLKNAKAYVEKGMTQKAINILEKHYDDHISETCDQELNRLHTYLTNYRGDIEQLIRILRNPQKWGPRAFNQNWIEAEKNLKGMDKEIRNLMKLKKTELE